MRDVDLGNGRSWVCLVMTELDLISLLFSLIVKRVSACIGLGLGAGVVCNVLSVVGIVWAGHSEGCGDGTLGSSI